VLRITPLKTNGRSRFSVHSRRDDVEQKAYAGVSRARPGSYDEQQIFQGQKLNENTQHEYTDLDQWTEYTYCLTDDSNCQYIVRKTVCRTFIPVVQCDRQCVELLSLQGSTVRCESFSFASVNLPLSALFLSSKERLWRTLANYA
jgi:hypothetical protein